MIYASRDIREIKGVSKLLAHPVVTHMIIKWIFIFRGVFILLI
jgi:hypothetical protein